MTMRDPKPVKSGQRRFWQTAVCATSLVLTVGHVAAQDETLYQVGGDVSAPKVLYAPSASALMQSHAPNKLSGSVIVGLVVNRDGKPVRVHLLKASQVAFDQKAVELVEAYKFKPAMKDGKPVAVELTVHFDAQQS